jgi:hypothetical protein
VRNAQAGKSVNGVPAQDIKEQENRTLFLFSLIKEYTQLKTSSQYYLRGRRGESEVSRTNERRTSSFLYRQGWVLLLPMFSRRLNTQSVEKVLTVRLRGVFFLAVPLVLHTTGLSSPTLPGCIWDGPVQFNSKLM